MATCIGFYGNGYSFEHILDLLYIRCFPSETEFQAVRLRHGPGATAKGPPQGPGRQFPVARDPQRGSQLARVRGTADWPLCARAWLGSCLGAGSACSAG